MPGHAGRYMRGALMPGRRVRGCFGRDEVPEAPAKLCRDCCNTAFCEETQVRVAKGW